MKPKPHLSKKRIAREDDDSDIKLGRLRTRSRDNKAADVRAHMIC